MPSWRYPLKPVPKVVVIDCRLNVHHLKYLNTTQFCSDDNAFSTHSDGPPRTLRLINLLVQIVKVL